MCANTEAMHAYLTQLGAQLNDDVHATLVLDGALLAMAPGA